MKKSVSSGKLPCKELFKLVLKLVLVREFDVTVWFSQNGNYDAVEIPQIDFFFHFGPDSEYIYRGLLPRQERYEFPEYLHNYKPGINPKYPSKIK